MRNYKVIRDLERLDYMNVLYRIYDGELMPLIANETAEEYRDDEYECVCVIPQADNALYSSFCFNGKFYEVNYTEDGMLDNATVEIDGKTYTYYEAEEYFCDIISDMISDAIDRQITISKLEKLNPMDVLYRRYDGELMPLIANVNEDEFDDSELYGVIPSAPDNDGDDYWFLYNGMYYEAEYEDEDEERTQENATFDIEGETPYDYYEAESYFCDIISDLIHRAIDRLNNKEVE